MASAVNIPLGLTVTDLVAGFKLAGQTTAEFTSQFKAKFDGLKGSTDAPTGALSSLVRNLNATKREISDLIAVGAPISSELGNKFNLLKGSVDAVKNAFNTPIQVGAFQGLQNKLAETKAQIQDLRAKGEPVPSELASRFRTLENQVAGVNRTISQLNPSPYAALNQRLSETKSKIQDILAAGEKIPRSLSGQFSQLTRQVNQINTAVTPTPSLFDRLGNVGGILGLTGGLLSVGAALNLVKQGLSITSDFQRLDSALLAISSSSLDFGRTQNFLRATSNDLGISYEALASSYKGLKAATNNTVLEGVATERIFLSVARAGASLKLSNDEVRGSLLAIQQMMSKGTVQAEELRGQLGERLPGAFRLMAQGLGVTEVKLNKMLEQGQVLAADALPKLAIELEKAFGASAQNNVNTMAGGFTRATDQLKLFIAEFSQKNGVDGFFAKIGNNVANTISGIREAQNRGISIFNVGRRPELIEQAKLRVQIQKGTPAENATTLASVQARINEAVTRIKSPQLFTDLGSGLKTSEAAVVDANKKLLADLQERVQIIRRESRRAGVAADEEATRAAANQAKLALSPKFDIDKKRAEQSALATRIANGIGNGENVRALQAQYSKLTAEIDRATASTQKQRAAAGQAFTTLGVFERLKKGLTDDIQRARTLNVGVDPKTFFALDNVTRIIARIKGETAKDLTIKINVQEKLKQAITDAVTPFALTPGLLARFREPLNFGSLGFFQQQLESIKTQVSTFSLKGLAVPQSVMDSYAEYLGIINRVSRETADKEALAGIRADNLAGGLGPGVVAVQKVLESVRAIKGGINVSVKEVADAMKAGRQELKSAGVNLLSGIGESIGKGENPLKTALRTIVGFLGDFMIKIGTAMVLGGTLLTAAVTAFPFLAPFIGIKGPAGVIAGAGLVVGGAAVKAIPFANGGLVTGSVFANVGEGAGTSRSNPELIMPVDRLKKFLGNQRGSAQVFIPENRIDGNDIVTVYRRVLDSEQYTR